MGAANKCSVHAERDAAYTCAVCHTPMCDECVHTREEGSIVCAGCLAPLESLDPVEPNAGLYDLGGPPAPAAHMRPAVSILGKCRVHPDNHAVALCSHCTAPICATCDFAFPGGIHLCPTCATDPKQALTPKRKSQAYWSIGLGAFNVLATIGIFVMAASLAQPGGVDKDTVQMIGCCVILLGVLSIVGLGVGASAFNRRTHNPGILWIGPVLNGIICAFWIFRIIAGNMSH